MNAGVRTEPSWAELNTVVQIEMCGAKRERNRNAKWSNICCRWVCYVPTNQSMHDVFCLLACLVFVLLPLLLLFIILCRCLFSLSSRCACVPVCVCVIVLIHLLCLLPLHPIRALLILQFIVAVFTQPPHHSYVLRELKYLRSFHFVHYSQWLLLLLCFCSI